MKSRPRSVRGSGGRLAPFRHADTIEELDDALQPGVIVEVDAETAEACGAWIETALDEDEAFDAAYDPASLEEASTQSPR